MKSIDYKRNANQIKSKNRNKNKMKVKITPRHRAREIALQAIYQWQFTDDPSTKLELQFSQDINPKKVDIAYFIKLLKGVIKESSTLDETMLPILDRKLSDLNPVELAVLRLAIYELIYNLDVPCKVVINEALELAKTFGSIEGFKYVNGILDKVARKLREQEMPTVP
jgi:transcription antitermination protein NusB